MKSEKSGIPAAPDRVVERPKVSARLDEALRRPFTTLTAPAGYGKTVAAAQWCRRQECPVVWVDLGDTARDPDLRWTRVIDAFRTGLGVDLSVAHHSLAIGELLPLLRVAQRTIFVFDGIPAWDTDHILELAGVLSGAHECELRALAISRCPPSPELTPLELQGVVSHLTISDLRAGADEVAAVVEAYSGRPIDTTTAEELATSLDGWIAGAAIAGMRRPPGPAGETATSAELLDAAWEGIEGYLTAEVIGRLPTEIRSFVLRTACVDELSGALCDRVAGRSDSGSMLRSLMATGVPMTRDRTRRDAYRYQPQFRAVVDSIAEGEDATGRAAALRLAADWYNEHEQPFEAAAGATSSPW